MPVFFSRSIGELSPGHLILLGYSHPDLFQLSPRSHMAKWRRLGIMSLSSVTSSVTTLPCLICVETEIRCQLSGQEINNYCWVSVKIVMGQNTQLCFLLGPRNSAWRLGKGGKNCTLLSDFLLKTIYYLYSPTHELKVWWGQLFFSSDWMKLAARYGFPQFLRMFNSPNLCKIHTYKHRHRHVYKRDVMISSSLCSLCRL